MSDEFTGTEIAIIGMAGRYPRSPNLDAFWRHLRDGDELISTFSDEELLAQGADPALLRNSNFVKAAGVLEDMERFDAAFFGFMPREAELMDPQQRLLLECAWEAFESAGYAPGRYNGPIGVYVGAVENTYLLFNLMTNPQVRALPLLPVMFVNGRDYLPTRISYKLNLRGPSCLVQSACSTSLVAIHNACQSLINGECDMALAGGVSVLVHQRMGYLYQEGGIVSPDGRCRSFDAQAQGTIFSSGLGLVVLKPLEKALADGDTIHAVIRGSAVNNDGAVKVSYTAPSVNGQAEVIVEALANAAVSAETISYVEAHGTATPIGDTIEVEALTQAFRKVTDRSGFCALGSVKSNLGHLDAAAGVTGVIKTVLALKHGLIPPSLHFETANPKIDFVRSPFYVNTRLAEWLAGSAPRRAGVSSFGIGGTNAHLILEEAPPPEPGTLSRPWQLLLLSARTATALETATTHLAAHLRDHPDLHLADVAYTLQVGRSTFTHRCALVCRDQEAAATTLERARHQAGAPASVTDEVFGSAQKSDMRHVVFMFPGQGTQYPQMARELYREEPTFRTWLDRCATLLQPLLGLDIRSVIFDEPPSTIDQGPAMSGDSFTSQTMERTEGASGLALSATAPVGAPPHPHPPPPNPLYQTWLAQPALFAVEYALAQLWISWGVRPRAMIGHSIGEYVAACLADVLSLDDALRLVAVRGQLMQRTEEGAMLAVGLPATELRRRAPALDLAAINAPAACVVSGYPVAVAELERQLTAEGITCRRLYTSHAFHSALMDPILEEFAAEVRRVRLHPPRIPLISNLTGDWIRDEQATDPAYWTRQLRQTVRFADGVNTLLVDFRGVLLEVGPGQTLGVLARQCSDRAADLLVCSSLRYSQESVSDVAVILKAVGQLWVAGVALDWAGFYAHERRRRVPLPTYPFERRRYWIDPLGAPEQAAPASEPAAAAPAAGDLPAVVAEPAGAALDESASAAQQHDAAPAPRTAGRRTDPRALEQIVAQQIAILSEQLQILRDDRIKKRKGL